MKHPRHVRLWMVQLAGIAVLAGSLNAERTGVQQTAPLIDSQSGYALGPEDQIRVRVLDADEIGVNPVRVDTDGYIRLPVVGRVRAGGRTLDDLESDIRDRLKPIILKPDVSITVSEFRSQPVSVIGAVRTPGVHQLQGRRTLVEVLSLAGGLTETAGPSVTITRRQEFNTIPLPGATVDETGRFSVAEVKLAQILGANSPEQNIMVQPHDVISVPRAELIYVVGQVVRAGGFVLHERESLSVLQALSLAGGLDRMAAPQQSRILRSTPDASKRSEIPVDLRKMLDGRAEDLALRKDDILFVPSSAPKQAGYRALETAIQIGTGVVIWRR